MNRLLLPLMVLAVLACPASASASYSAPPDLTLAKARSYLPSALYDRYGSKFTKRQGRLQRACYRLSSTRVRCFVYWRYRKWRYTGNVTLRYDPDAPEYPDYTIRIGRSKPPWAW